MRCLAIALLLLVGCGGNPCNDHDASFSYTATQTQLLGPGDCTDLPVSFPVSATWKGEPDGSYLLSGTENGVAFTTQRWRGFSSNCYVGPTWSDATTWHMYFLPFADGAAELHIGRQGQCMAVYSLR